MLADGTYAAYTHCEVGGCEGGCETVNFFESFVDVVVADTRQIGKSGRTEGCRKHKGCDCAGGQSADFPIVLEEIGGR
jgi:hypothetical protein